MIGRAPKSHERIDPKTGRVWYGKSDKIFFTNPSRDRKIKAENKRGRREPRHIGDLEKTRL